MADTPNESADITETDIVFDCPHCSKSLVIDYRGAGLCIPCTDCGSEVEVPIPDGMELADMDRSDAEQEFLILNLRRSLAAAELRVSELEARIEELTAEGNKLDDTPADTRIRQVVQMVDTLEAQNASVGKSILSIREFALSNLKRPPQDSSHS
jgi:transcription elongation factor Elf1